MNAKALQLVIGDKNLSSWSMRPWLALKVSGLSFKEIQVLLDRPDTAKKLKRLSPSQRVPVLHHHNLQIWDLLAICKPHCSDLVGLTQKEQRPILIW